MKSFHASSCVAVVCIAAFSLATTVHGRSLAPPKPDIVITGVELIQTHACTPGATLYTYRVGLKNAGNGPFVGVINGFGQGSVFARDQHPAPANAPTTWQYWQGAQQGVTPNLQPGQTTSVILNIPYYAYLPQHMTMYATHPFGLTVQLPTDTPGVIGPGPTITVVAPKGCPVLKIPKG